MMRKRFFLILLIVFAAACDDQSDSGSGSTVLLPGPIAASVFPNTGELRAFLYVDGSGPTPMTINGSEATVQVAVTPGEHVFTIEFQFVTPQTTLVMANADKSLNVGAGSNRLEYADTDYQYPDDDNDGVSNLKEVTNIAPVAVATASSYGRPSTSHLLRGDNSSDPDLDELTFTWSLISKPIDATAVISNVTARNPRFTANMGGQYVLQLVVNDGLVDSEPDRIVIKLGDLWNEFIDFETPVLGVSVDFAQVEPYISGRVSFFEDTTGILGVVKNSYTSACTEPSNDNQKLGTGTTLIGRSGYPINIVFDQPVVALSTPSIIRFKLQTGLDASARIRLYNSLSNQVAEVIQTVGTAAGTCGYPGTARGVFDVNVSTRATFTEAIIDVPGGGRVFVIDDVEIIAGQILLIR